KVIWVGPRDCLNCDVIAFVVGRTSCDSECWGETNRDKQWTPGTPHRRCDVVVFATGGVNCHDGLFWVVCFLRTLQTFVEVIDSSLCLILVAKDLAQGFS